MAKNEEDDLQKVTLNLYNGDVDRLRQYYPDVGASPIIRRLVRAYLSQIEITGATPDLNASVEIRI